MRTTPGPWLIVTLIAAATASAAEDDAARRPFEPTGLYIGAAGIALFDDFDDDLSLAALPIAKTDPAFGAAGWVGHRLHRHFAVEGRFDWIDGFDVRLDNGHKGRPHTDLEAWTLGIDGKLYLPLGRFQPFMKLGVGAIRAKLDGPDEDRLASDPSGEDFFVRIGGGVDFYVTRNVALVVSGERVIPVDELSDIPFMNVTLGFQYRF